MHENRNASVFNGGQGCANTTTGNGMVCIDTRRVLDSCRDRDCFEETRVYLTAEGEEALANSTNVRTRSARLLWAYVGVEEVPFNCGFYQITVRYYIEVEFESCLGVGRSTTFRGLTALEKNVILYGGEGRAISFTSTAGGGYCSVCDMDNMTTNDPIAVVETVEPIVLGTKVVDCNCPCACNCSDFIDIPTGVSECFGADIVTTCTTAKILVSFGIFSVVRMERPAQLLVNATDYSVPDKECNPATNNDNPCALFKTIAFPTNQFRGTSVCAAENNTQTRNNGPCGCNKN